MDTDLHTIKNILQILQKGYIKRDLENVEDYLEFFHPELTCVITGTGYNERYNGVTGAQKLLKSDWEFWGDVNFNFEQATINIFEQSAYVVSQGSVSQHLDVEHLYASGVNAVIPDIIEDQGLSAKIKLLEILRYTATNLLEAEKGDTFEWVLRFSAMLVKYQEHWRFVHMHFSHPNMIFPQIRLNVPSFLK